MYQGQRQRYAQPSRNHSTGRTDLQELGDGVAHVLLEGKRLGLLLSLSFGSLAS